MTKSLHAYTDYELTEKIQAHERWRFGQPDGVRFDLSVLVDLIGLNLEAIKTDFLSIINITPTEVAGLKKALIEGRVDGSAYTGSCACLVGTIANLRGVDVFSELPHGAKPDSDRPAERFFAGIDKGDTPKNNSISKIVLGWIEEWESQHVTNE